MIYRVIFSILILFTLPAHPHSVHQQQSATPQILAPGYQQLNYTAPLAGSYALPPLGMAGNGTVLDITGKTTELHDFMGDKIVVMSFIYTTCNDINGCPLASYVCSIVQNRLIEAADIGAQVRFISISFDPVNDTPSVMASYGERFIKSNFDWKFLTTSSENTLSPILTAYNQTIQKDINERGEYTGSFSHILRVFLIDKRKQIRNIYSTSFLHPDIVINDIKTLLMEQSLTVPGNTGQKAGVNPARHGPGDFKTGYEHKDYQTSSLSLNNRTGMKHDLLDYINHPPTGLPTVPVPDDNPITVDKITLGRRLFFDRRLSHNNTISCAMCHIPEQGFASNELATAIGIEGKTVRRNAPTIYNVSYATRFFHDARESRLEQQIWGPLLAGNEMGNPSVGLVIEKIKSLSDYQGIFEDVFGNGPTMETIGQAIASYERTLISGNSPFDRWYYKKEPAALTPAAIRGFMLFTGKGRCNGCHMLNRQYALFTDHQLHNTGIGYLRSMQKDPEQRRVLVAPGTYLTVETAIIADASEPKPNDLGYYEVTGNPDDRWKYKTPILRNISLTAPYMHDGSLSALQDVIEFYNKGGIENELLDPLIRPLDLSKSDKSDLLEFLQSLTGDNVADIVMDAFAAPVGNTLTNE